MADHTYLIFLCCVVLSIHGAVAKPSGSSSSSSSDEDDGIQIDGDYILNLGNATRDSLLTMIGHVFKNFERNLTASTQQTRLEAFLHALCDQAECESWPEWPECPALKDEWAVVYRERQCGFNTTHCGYPYYKQRTERESRICVGFRQVLPSDSDEDKSSVEVSTTTAEPTTTTPPPSVQCPANYEAVKDFCLRYVSTFRLAYDSANMLCNWDQGTLINVDTVEKMQALYILLHKHNHNETVWLDGKRDDPESDFKYTDGFDPDINMWEFGEPASDFGTPGQPICRVDRGPGLRRWSAMPCNSKLNLVCEY